MADIAVASYLKTAQRGVAALWGPSIGNGPISDRPPAPFLMEVYRQIAALMAKKTA